MSDLSAYYPPNERYGTGIFRRRVRIEPDKGVVTATLNDTFHAMRVRLSHDGHIVTHAEAELSRFPMTTCPGAADPYRELIGLPVATDRPAFFAPGRASRNCTHLLDLGLLALGAVHRGDGPLVYDVAIPDAVDGCTVLTASVGGMAVHVWTLQDNQIVAPDVFAGRSVFGGFATWAEAAFQGVALDAARVAQKSVFVARGRAFEVDGVPPRPAALQVNRTGACFSFSTPWREQAVGVVGYARDYSSGIEEPDLPATSAPPVNIEVDTPARGLP